VICERFAYRLLSGLGCAKSQDSVNRCSVVAVTEVDASSFALLDFIWCVCVSVCVCVCVCVFAQCLVRNHMELLF
jgi:hypothetical protein